MAFTRQVMGQAARPALPRNGRWPAGRPAVWIGAVLLACLPLRPMPAAAEDWNAVSNTAMSITGDISVSKRAIVFQNGAKLKLGAATIVEDFDATGMSVRAAVYEVAEPEDPELENGNRLCGSGDVTYVALWHGEGADRMLAIFTGDESPESTEGMCGSYAYQVSN